VLFELIFLLAAPLVQVMFGHWCHRKLMLTDIALLLWRRALPCDLVASALGSAGLSGSGVLWAGRDVYGLYFAGDGQTAAVGKLRTPMMLANPCKNETEPCLSDA